MAKVKNKYNGFNPISRGLVFDKELSDRARFLYVYMACKPDGWDFYQDKIAEELGYKKDTLRKYLDELILRGWLTEEEQKNDGKFGCLEYTIEIERKRGNLPIRKKTDTEKNRIGKNNNHKDIDNISSKHSLSDIKEIENKERLSNDNQKENLDFDSFYELYPRKRSRLTAEKAWKKLSVKDRKEAIEKLPVYIADCAECKREVKYPATYLNQRTWEDDFTNNGKLSKEEPTEETAVIYPEGMTIEKWTEISLWMSSTVSYIAGRITPVQFDDMLRTCGDSVTLANMLTEINEWAEFHRDDDVYEEFKRRIKDSEL